MTFMTENIRGKISSVNEIIVVFSQGYSLSGKYVIQSFTLQRKYKGVGFKTIADHLRRSAAAGKHG